ncbi:MAG: diaminopimelate decarboxylase [Armatimonadetes bacterium]|nr:diaminopimelate decarboxylase [Armatimonadota bacterium]
MQGTSEETRFILTDEQVRSFAAEFGTPLYMIDENHLRHTIREYKAAFEKAWPGGEITFATKANSTLAVVRIAHEEGCLIDVASEGELRAALAAGVPANRCHLHGNNKKRHEIGFAAEQGVSQIVVDNFEEIEVIAEMGITCELMIRLAPGVDPKTNAKISTGQADTKFGFNVGDGSAEKALLRALELNLNVVGIHCHVGSQLLDPGAQVSAGEILASFAREMKEKHGFITKIINVGGGLGIHYVGDDKPLSKEEYCAQLCAPIKSALEGSGLDPVLVQEPGRSIIGESGVTVYEVGVVKTVPAKKIGTRTYVAVDGGLSDNPRPAMYGSPYTVLLTPQHPRDLGSMKTVTVSGKHCETDRLFPDIQMPESVKSGDFLQVLCTGAYNSSMANNYNRYQRPATAMLRSSGEAQLVQRPETWDEMFAREILPEDL